MTDIIGELLFAMVRALIANGSYCLFIKVGTWLDTKIAGRVAKVVTGMFLGIAAYFIIPIFAGLLDF
jgi:hypothetical protein